MTCLECGHEAGVREDPRTPPLELGDEVLCEGCYVMALEECLEVAQGEVDHYSQLLEEAS